MSNDSARRPIKKRRLQSPIADTIVVALDEPGEEAEVGQDAAEPLSDADDTAPSAAIPHRARSEIPDSCDGWSDLSLDSMSGLRLRQPRSEIPDSIDGCSDKSSCTADTPKQRRAAASQAKNNITEQYLRPYGRLARRPAALRKNPRQQLASVTPKTPYQRPRPGKSLKTADIHSPEHVESAALDGT